MALRGSGTFLAGEGCEQFVALFHAQFGGSYAAQAAAVAAGVPMTAPSGPRGSIVLPGTHSQLPAHFAAALAAASAAANSNSSGSGGAQSNAASRGKIPGLPCPPPQGFFNIGDDLYDDADGGQPSSHRHIAQHGKWGNRQA